MIIWITVHNFLENTIWWNESIEEPKKLQNIFKSHLNETAKERFKSIEQKSLSENIKLLYESREAVIQLFNDYSSIASEAKQQAKYGECLKILTPKQML